MQKTKQTIYKAHFFLIGLLFFSLFLIPVVSATDYTYWQSHYINTAGATAPSSGVPPNGIEEVYWNSPPITSQTGTEFCAERGSTVYNQGQVVRGVSVSHGGVSYTYTQNLANSAVDNLNSSWTMIPSNNLTSSLFVDKYGRSGYSLGWSGDLGANGGWAYANGAAFQDFKSCSKAGVNTQYKAGPLYVYYNEVAPTDYNTPNITVIAASASSGITIARANVDVWETYNTVVRGKTDLNGEFTSGIESNSINSLKNITVYKVGYDTSVISYNLVEDSIVTVYLNDSTYTPLNNNAVVYLDIADETTKESISGATVGINNLTSSLNSWSYNLYPESTIAFTTDGYGHNLSVGQTIQFAGYKTGYYSAGHTEEFTILSPTSKATLYLSKSDETNVTSNLTAKYFYPVSVVDAITGNNIAGSSLNVSLYNGGETNWYNTTSLTGKFNITGYGVGGLIPIQAGDVINLYADANGYEWNGWGLIASQENNGITQMRPLMPNGITPIDGEFNVQVLVVDNDNMKPLGGVVLKVSGLGNDVTQISNNGGASVFKNLTSGSTYSIQASAYGYTTTSQTFSGESGETSYVDFFLSKSSMNPIYTVPITPEPTYTPIITYPVVTPVAWQNESAVSCIEVPKNATFIQFMKIKLACNGFDTAMSQSLAIAGIIIMLFVGIGAQYGKANGAVIGGIIGFVLAYAMGVIPFSVLALIIALLVLVAIISITRK